MMYIFTVLEAIKAIMGLTAMYYRFTLLQNRTEQNRTEQNRTVANCALFASCGSEAFEIEYRIHDG